MTKQSGVVYSLTGQDWWVKLSEDEQKQTAFEDEHLNEGLMREGEGRLAIGKSLAEIQNILESKGLFLAYLKYRNQFSHRKFSQRTAYRYIAGWKHAHETIPQVALAQALRHGMEIIGSSDAKPFGVYTEAIENVPPPKKATVKTAAAWLRNIEEFRSAKKPPGASPPSPAREIDEEELMHEAFVLIVRRLNRLPLKSQAKWIVRLSGLLMKAAKVVKAQMVKPAEIPEGWEATRGRPKKAA
jgi:hypothetical protein